MSMMLLSSVLIFCGVHPFFMSLERHRATLDCTYSLGVIRAFSSMSTMPSILSSSVSFLRCSAIYPSETTTHSFL